MVLPLLPEEEAISLYAVIQRECIYVSGLRPADKFLVMKRQRMMLYPELNPVTEMTEEKIEHRREIPRCIYMEVCPTPYERHCREKAENAEAMVSVKVGNENMIYLHHRQMVADQLELRTLAAVDQKQTSTGINHVDA